jgi:hypothetical protein
VAEDPFAPVQVRQEGPFITFSIKSGGGYADTMLQIRGTIPEVGSVLKVDTDTVDNPVWTLALRANDLARALQADEAKKQASAGKA